MRDVFVPCLLLSLTRSVLLVSTGLWVPQQVDFVGSDLVEGYESIPVDPEEYRDQAVLILGKGNAAFETAQSIMGRASRVHLYSPNPVRLAWQTHYVGDLRCELADLFVLCSALYFVILNTLHCLALSYCAISTLLQSIY